jgi:hypothetical protein
MTSAKTAEANAARDVAALKSKLAAVLCSFCLESFHENQHSLLSEI